MSGFHLLCPIQYEMSDSNPFLRFRCSSTESRLPSFRLSTDNMYNIESNKFGSLNDLNILNFKSSDYTTVPLLYWGERMNGRGPGSRTARWTVTGVVWVPISNFIWSFMSITAEHWFDRLLRNCAKTQISGKIQKVICSFIIWER